jgi:hypothetical protein
MRPEGHGDEARARLGCPGGTDELDVSSMDSIEVADHYDGRRAQFNAPPDPSVRNLE